MFLPVERPRPNSCYQTGQQSQAQLVYRENVTAANDFNSLFFCSICSDDVSILY